MRKVVLVGLALAVGCGGNSFTAAVGTESCGASSGGAIDAGGDGSASEAGAASIGGVNGAGASGRAGHGGHAGSAGRAGGGGIGGQSGTSAGGAGSGNAGSGNAGSGGGGVGPTCSQLYSRANAQLVAARGCDKSLNAQQCTGSVATTCGCEVPVEKNESAETKAYLATVNEIHQKMCQQICPLVACVPVSGPECNVPSGSGTVGECIDTTP